MFKLFCTPALCNCANTHTLPLPYYKCKTIRIWPTYFEFFKRDMWRLTRVSQTAPSFFFLYYLYCSQQQAGVPARSELTNQQLSCCWHNNTFLIGRHWGSANNIFFSIVSLVRWIAALWSNADQLLGHKSCHRWCLWTWMLSYRPDISSVTVPRHLKSFAHSRNPPLSSHYLCVASRNQVVGLAHN